MCVIMLNHFQCTLKGVVSFNPYISYLGNPPNLGLTLLAPGRGVMKSTQRFLKQQLLKKSYPLPHLKLQCKFIIFVGLNDGNKKILIF